MCDRDGGRYLLVGHPTARRVLLLTEREGRWRASLLYQGAADREAWSIRTVLLPGPGGRPVALVARESERHGWLRLFEPER